MGEEWKLISTPETGETELYNLIADPGEQRNAAREEPRITEEFLEKIVEWKTGGSRSPATFDAPAGDEDRREILRSLGYIE